MERLDLVQFHWWDFNVPRYVETALELDRLRRAGKIAHFGVTNFDTPHLHEIVAAGVPIVAHQLQYSLVDDRPSSLMVDFCRPTTSPCCAMARSAAAFCPSAGSDNPSREGELANRSLMKYKLIIDDFGGWDLFQNCSAYWRALPPSTARDCHGRSRAMLDRPQVAAAIVGATNTAHLRSTSQIGLARARCGGSGGDCGGDRPPARTAGDVYALERDRTGRHGQIMKYELNSLPENTPTSKLA